MKLYSTKNTENSVSFQEALFKSLPSDGGLYMPEQIKPLPASFFEKLPTLSLPEIAFEVSKHLIGDEINDVDLLRITQDAINFDAPLHPVGEQTFCLELFHGPSLAFKDFGARFMSRMMAYFSQQNEGLLDILVATSGDTGGAVALGFFKVPNTRVTILYPKGKVSEIQEEQLTKNGENIRAIAVEGTFDDCQAMVKKAFMDAELNAKMNLTSANSINIARLIPQTFYYFYAYQQALKLGYKEVIFSVPSGNFGNIGAGVWAHQMGLPVKLFLASNNANDTVPHFLNHGVYEAKPAVATLSNAMDVGNPSNWQRVEWLFGNNLFELKQKFEAQSFTDEETLNAIQYLYEHEGYIACPHTAIGWLGLQALLKKEGVAYIFLGTAHPCKFMPVFDEDLQTKIQIPEQVLALKHKEKHITFMAADDAGFKAYLLSN